MFLTHTHVDHVASLPIFVENVFDGGPDCLTIHASHDVIGLPRRDIFNDRVWPDFFRLATPEAPFMRVETLRPGVRSRSPACGSPRCPSITSCRRWA